jgi:hypothetical protein
MNPNRHNMKIQYNFLILSLLFCCITSILYAQTTPFSRVFYDLAGSAQGYAVAKTMDQNYVIAGERDSRALVMKIDQGGNILWSRKIGNFDVTRFNCIAATHDSCFILAGYTMNTLNWGNEIFCVKIDLKGDTLWTRTIDAGESAVAFSVQETSDHGFILAGHTSHTGAPYSSVVVVKLDSAGNLSWNRLISAGTAALYAYSIRVTTDGGFIIAGELNTFSPYTGAACLLKLTSSGAISWAKKLSPGATDYLSGLDMAETATGYLFLTSSYSNGMNILKTDLSGNYLWGKTFDIFSGGYMTDVPRPKLHPTSDGGYIFMTTATWGFNPMIKIDSSGNSLWGQTLAFIGIDIVESNDHGYLALGNGPVMGVIMAPTDRPQIGIIKTDSSGNGTDCVYPTAMNTLSYLAGLSSFTAESTTGATLARSRPAVIGTELSISEGCVAITGSVDDARLEGNPFRVSPNPSDGHFQITVDQPGSKAVTSLKIFDVMGNKVYESSTPIINKTQINLNSRPNGVYFIQAQVQNKKHSQKILICH